MKKLFLPFALTLALLIGAFAHAAKKQNTPVGDNLLVLTQALKQGQCPEFKNAQKANWFFMVLAQANYQNRLLPEILNAALADSNVKLQPVETPEQYVAVGESVSEIAIRGMGNDFFLATTNGRKILFRFAAVGNADSFACTFVP